MQLNKLREQLAQAFIASLNEGTLPWHKTWGGSRPRNAITSKDYRGVNALWLSLVSAERGFKDPRWCTFNQAKEKGWLVKKGAKSSLIEFWSLYDKKTRKTVEQSEMRRIVEADPDRKDDFILMSRTYCVFNAEQIDGIPELHIDNHVDVDSIRAKRDVLLQNMGLAFREGGDRACYSPSEDRITMPPDIAFHDTYSYMSTFLHECGHATGHESRLNRDLSGLFGTERYAKEELRAEIASAFTAQALGFGAHPGAQASAMDNHKAYIQNWIDVIEDQPNELFAAIRDAENISDYLLEKGEFLKDLERDESAIEEKPSLDEQIQRAQSRGAGERQSPFQSLTKETARA